MNSTLMSLRSLAHGRKFGLYNQEKFSNCSMYGAKDTTYLILEVGDERHNP